MSNQSSPDLKAFRRRLRHDRLLRLRLRHLKMQATVALANELGFMFSVEDLSAKAKPDRERSKALK